MVQRVTIRSEQDYYALLNAAAFVLARYRQVLAHPALDVSPAELEEYERDAQALAVLLPEKLRGVVEAESRPVGAAPF